MRIRNLSAPEYNLQTKKGNRYSGSIASAVAISIALLLQGAVHKSKEEQNIRDILITSIEAEMPSIIADNQQIYEFLDGNIDENDTQATVYAKLDKVFQEGIAPGDKILKEGILLEIQYRHFNDLPYSTHLLEGLAQIQMRRVILNGELRAKFYSLSGPSDIGSLNQNIIDYLGIIGKGGKIKLSNDQEVNIWSSDKWKSWEDSIKQERIDLDYAQDFSLFLQQNSGDNTPSQETKKRIPNCKTQIQA